MKDEMREDLREEREVEGKNGEPVYRSWVTTISCWKSFARCWLLGLMQLEREQQATMAARRMR